MGNGEPGTGCRLPSAATANEDIVLENVLLVNRNLLSGLSLTSAVVLEAPVWNGEPGTGVRVPSLAME
jgi:hypothetical protein